MQSTFPVGSLIRGQFVVVDLLGKGPCGAVYLVRDKRNDYNRFVIKEVVSAVRKKRHGSPFDVATLSRLNHPALPHIYQVFHSDKQNRVYFLMDYIEGRNLEVMLEELPEEKRLSLPQAMTLLSPIMDAVSYLHRQQPPLIHGDIKPSNIIVPKVGTPSVLVDFGGVKELGSDTIITPHHGTLNYRAPEQYSRGASLRTDIYALGAILYTLLTGSAPAAAPDRLKRPGEKEPDPLLPVNQITPSVPATVAEAIHCAMSIDSHDRFSTVDQFWEALWQVIYANPTATQVPELTITLPTEENTELDDDLTVPWLPKSMITPPIEENTELDDDPTAPRLPRMRITPPIEENTELDTIQVTPQMPEPVVVVEPEMELPTLIANSTIQTEPVLVGTSSDPPRTPALPGEGKPPVGVPFQGRSPVNRAKKPGLPLLLCLCLALLVSIGLGSGLWLSIAAHHLPTTGIPASTGQFKATPPAKITATAAPVSTSYPNVVRPYNGTIYNLPDNLSTKMSLTGMRQNQGNIGGYFTGLHVNGSFKGTINASSHIEFTVRDPVAHITLSFDGAMQSDGNLSGDFCNLNQEGQCAGGYGVWSVAPEV